MNSRDLENTKQQLSDFYNIHGNKVFKTSVLSKIKVQVNIKNIKNPIGFLYAEFFNYGKTLKVQLTNKDGNTYDRYIHYQKIDLLDENDKPIVYVTRDITGRMLNVDDYIVFSGNEYSNTHKLEIGKILSISQNGHITAKILIKNGQNVNGDKIRRIHDSDKTMLIPVNDTDMMMWLLKEFKDIREDD